MAQRLITGEPLPIKDGPGPMTMVIFTFTGKVDDGLSARSRTKYVLHRSTSLIATPKDAGP